MVRSPTSISLSLAAIFSALILLFSSATAFAEINQAKIVEQSFGRDFGVLVGDRLENQYIIEVPAEFSLSPASLPPVGDVNYWLRLVSINYQEIANKYKVKKYQLDIIFQTFYAPLDVRVLTTPAVEIDFHSVDKRLDINIPEWHFSMSPLKESTPSDKGGRPFMKPDISVAEIDTSDLQIQTYSLVVIFLILFTLWLIVTGRLFQVSRSPFQQAIKQLKQLKKTPDSASLTKAIQSVHHAFNGVADKAVFSHQIDRFIADFPEYRRYKQDINDFYSLSTNVLYSDLDAKPEHFEQLLSLCSTMAKTEKMALKK